VSGGGGASGAAGTGSGGTAGAAGMAAGGAAGGVAGAAGSGGAAGAAGSGGAAGAVAGTGGNGGSPTCGTSTDPSTGSGCNTLEATGACVIETIGTGLAPSPAGGTIVAGTYDLTSMIRYPGTDGGSDTSDVRRQSLMVSSIIGNSFSIQITEVSGSSVQRQAGTVVASGTQVSFTPACPLGGDGGGTAGYSATATTFALFDMNGSGDLRVSMFMRR
jgi:hypothetical protein